MQFVVDARFVTVERDMDFVGLGRARVIAARRAPPLRFFLHVDHCDFVNLCHSFLPFIVAELACRLIVDFTGSRYLKTSVGVNWFEYKNGSLASLLFVGAEKLVMSASRSRDSTGRWPSHSCTTPMHSLGICQLSHTAKYRRLGNLMS